MANVKNFGLVGVGSDLQFGKAGTRLVNNAGTFNFKGANGTTDAALTAAGITASGDVALTAANGVVSIDGTNMIQKNATTGAIQLAGTSSVVMPTGNTAARGTAALGAMRVNSDSETAATVEYYNGTEWTTIATGGNAAALQTEVNNIEATLGSMINSDGTTNVAAALTSTLFGGATTLTTALNNLASGVAGKDTLDEIFPSTQAGNVIYSNGSNSWVQAAPGSTSGVQAYDAGLAALASKTSTGIIAQTGNDTYTAVTVSASGGLTVTDTTGTDGGLAFGTTGNLAALNSMSTSGIAVRNSDGTWANKTISSDNAELTVTNGDGTSAGNIKLNLDGKLAALSGLTTQGFLKLDNGTIVSSGEITGTSGNIVVTNGTGHNGNPTIDLAGVTQASTGDFVKVTLDSFGRVTGNTAVTTADITALVDATYVNVSGDTMTGDLDFGGTKKVTGLATPTNAGDAANKAYVDNAVSGLTWKQAVNVLAVTNVPLTGGATLSIDGHTVDNGYRVLLTNQTTGTEDGIYVVSGIGTAYALTRSTDADTYQELIGAGVFVLEGTAYANTGWVQSNHYLTSFASQTWNQFSGAGAYSAGNGIDITGTTVTAVIGDGLEFVGGAITVAAATGNAVQLVGTSPAKKVELVLDTGSGLEQSATGLKISASGVTNTMLANSTLTLDGQSGTGSIALGGTLTVNGAGALSTAVSGSTYTISVADATTTSKGVASFNSASFDVTSGAVSIKSGGVSNAQLANSVITFAADSGTADAVALGETFTLQGDAYISTAVTANKIALTLGTVDVAHGGTGATSFTAGQLLIGNGTSAIAQSAELAFNDTTNVLTVGGALPLAISGELGSITATATNSDIVLMPNGTGSVVVGPVGAGLIQSDDGTALTVRGNTTLTLESGTGSTTMKLASGTSTKVSVSGPTAADYATGLAANDLTNKQYVDDAIQTGAASGSIKAVKVALSGSGTTNVGAALPAGATVLSVKLVVTAADASATVSVGKSGGVAAYMTTGENDPSATGMYMAETYATETGSEQVIATVASATTFAGNVIVEYQVA